MHDLCQWMKLERTNDMATKNLYRFMRTQNGNLTSFEVYKLDEDYKHLKTYMVSEVAPDSWVCNCPAWKTDCKHIELVKQIQAFPPIDERRPNSFAYSYLYNEATKVFE